MRMNWDEHGDETAGEGVEVGQGGGERVLEVVEEGGWGGRRVGKEETLLDVVSREHGQVPWGQVYANVLSRWCWMGLDYLC